MLDLKIDRDKAGLRAHVEEQARKAIQSGVFPRGSRVTKEALGISRTFIREAVRRLQVEGIVSHLAHRGVRIVSVNDYEAEQIDEVRQMPKAIAARDFARRAKDRDVE
jgi:DNA-binding GntR family transcriptional regulator